jgi:hypothetical protein
MRWLLLPALFLIAILAIGSAHRADAGGKDKKEPEKNDKPTLIIVPPAGGKEVKLVEWRFLQGTRHFDLIDDKPKAKNAGPEYLEFRDEKSTTFVNGILTLVPLTSIKKIDYDREKKLVSLTAVVAGDKDVTLTGTTKFVGINKITIEGETVLDGLGAATVKFQGGIDKGLQSVTFAAPKPVVETKGKPARVVATDKEKSKHIVMDLQPLYQVDGKNRVLPYLMFKKTVKIDLDKLEAMKQVVPEDKKKVSSDYEVTLKDGAKHTLTLLTKIDLEANKSATLEGFVSRVPAGYKLFPLHTIEQFRIGDEEKK